MVTTPTLWLGESQVNTTDAASANPGATASQYDGQVAGLADGGYVVVWKDGSGTFNPGDLFVLGQRYDVLGNKVGGEFAVADPVILTSAGPAVTALATGGFAVAISEYHNEYFVAVKIFDANGTLVREDTVTLPASTLNFAKDLSLAALPDGGYLLSYTRSGLVEDQIHARIVSGAGLVAPEIDVSDLFGNRESQVAVLSDGNFAAVWQNAYAINDNDIRFAIGGPNGIIVKTPAYVAAAGSFANETAPDIAALTGGGFAVAWTNSSIDGSGDGIRAAVYTNAGTIVGSEIQVNTATLGNQNEASVVGLADGGFVVTWEDDFAQLVRGQRFDASGARVGDEFLVKDGIGVDSPNSARLADGRIVYALGNTVVSDNDVVTTIFDPRTSPLFASDAGETFTSRRDGATVNGLGGNDLLIGLEGDDTLNGGPGDDTLIGGGGNNNFVIVGGEALGDVFAGGPGTDTILALGPVTLASFNAAAASIERWSGDGQGVFGTPGADVLDFSGLTATAMGRLDGSGGNDILIGSRSKDIVLGDIGRDRLTGGPGADQLYGGLDRDVFDFNAAGESGPGKRHDKIADFSHKDHDKIDLATIDANSQKAGNQRFHLVDAQDNGHDFSQSFAAYHDEHPQAKWSGLLRIDQGVIQGDVNGDGKVDFEIAVPGADLVRGDFFL